MNALNDRARRAWNTKLFLVALFSVVAIICFAIALHCFQADDGFWGITDLASGLFWMVLAIREARR